MDIREKVREIIHRKTNDYCPKEDIKCYGKPCLECYTDHILSLETDTEKIVVVKKVPDLTKVKLDVHSVAKMLKAGFVQLKEGG